MTRFRDCIVEFWPGRSHEYPNTLVRCYIIIAATSPSRGSISDAKVYSQLETLEATYLRDIDCLFVNGPLEG